jgi:hypothetical protein
LQVRSEIPARMRRLRSASRSAPRPSGQATNSRALPDPPDCEFDFVNGVINILFHQHPINIAGQK